MSEISSTTKISNPTNQKWFISWNNNRSEIIVYGSVLPNQYLETPYIEVDIFEIESDWNDILLENNINPSFT